MALEMDTLIDLRLDGDREVQVGADGDLETVSGVENLEQSAAIHAGQAVRPLIGEPITEQTLSRAQSALTDFLQEDPQLSDVQRVVIDNIDRKQNRVEVRVFVGANNDFRLNIDL